MNRRCAAFVKDDLAALKPGGRNTSVYTAALKVGSTLGAACSTPGAEQAAAEWTDQAAEEALMAAAEQNGYIADHSVSAARSAIRSGLRNGLRNPRPLPGFRPRSADRPLPGQPQRAVREPGTGTESPVVPAGAESATGDESRRNGRASGQASSPEQGGRSARQALPRGQRDPAGASDWRDVAIQEERGDRLSRATPSSRQQVITAQPMEAEIER